MTTWSSSQLISQSIGVNYHNDNLGAKFSTLLTNGYDEVPIDTDLNSEDDEVGIDQVKANNVTKVKPEVLFDLLSSNESDRYPEIEIDREGQLLLNLLKNRGLASDQIKSYENFIRYRIADIIRQRVIDLEDDTHVVFINPHESLPFITGKNRQPKVLYPREARERRLTYSMPLKIDLERRSNHDGKVIICNGRPEVIRDVNVGKIPVMLGSIYDNLRVHKITGHNLLEYGECPFDPFGYFIVSGVERIILMQERLRSLIPMLYRNPGGTKGTKGTKAQDVCRMTCSTARGSRIVELTYNIKQQCIRLKLQNFRGKRKDITIFQAFRLLGFNDMNQAVDFILFFIKDEWKSKALMQLQGSLVITTRICGTIDPNNPNSVNMVNSANIEDIYDQCLYAAPGKGQKNNYQQANNIDKKILGQEVYDEFISALFPHIDLNQARTKEEKQSMIEAKKILLGVMTARYVEYLAGLTKLDDRDSWTNKRLITAGNIMEQLFRRLWEILLNEIETDISGPAKRKTLEAVRQKINPSIITDSMESSFVPNQWGPPKMSKDDNVTDFLDRGESILSIFDQILRINTPTNRQAKQAGARGIQIDQTGCVCPVQTPSGEACGLVKSKAIGCWISVQSDETSCWKYLKDKIARDYSSQTANLCILNGKPLGWCNGQQLRTEMVQRRRKLEIPFDTALVIDKHGMFNVYTDSSRPTTPYLIVDADGQPLISKYNCWTDNFNSLLRNGIIEYLDIWEAIMHANVGSSLSKLTKEQEDRQRLQQMIARKRNQLGQTVRQTVRQKMDKQIKLWDKQLQRLNKKVYTHVAIDPNLNLGVAASIIPFITHNQSPRNNFQCAMGRQAMDCSNPSGYFPTTGRHLDNAAQGLVVTQLQKYLGLDDLPAGRTVILAIITDSCNEEDGVTLKKEFLEASAFDNTVVHSYDIIVRNLTKISNGEISEHLIKPKKAFPRHQLHQYDHLDENGIVRLNSVVESGDCLVGKVKRIKSCPKGANQHKPTVRYEDNSIYLDNWEQGIIDEVRLRKNANNEIIIDIRIRLSSRPIIGDKVATRAAQKSVISKIVPAADLPYTKDGITPDIIINPHALGKRMTIATYLEMVCSKLAAFLGRRINATAFKDYRSKDHEELLQELCGYDGSGEETLYYFSGGKQLQAKIMIGPSYYQLLKHQVRCKQQFRGEGPKLMFTRQPPSGRKKGGGVRFGEQERDGVLSHGGAHFLRDRMLLASDDYRLTVCLNCNIPAIANVVRDIIICRKCGGNNFANNQRAYTMSLLRNLSMITGVCIRPIYKLIDGQSESEKDIDEYLIEENDYSNDEEVDDD